MALDMNRGVRVVVLGLWTAFFIWLIVSGEIYRYIGPRTYWVVWFGAVALSAAFVSQVARTRAAHGSHHHHEISLPQVAGALALLVPILVLILVPTPKLGALAASNKATGGIATSNALQSPALQPGEEVSFVEINYASQSEEYAASIGIVDGYPVELTGFVTHPANLENSGFALTRFSIFCCAADVVPYSVPVDPADTPTAGFPDDTWLTVKGTLVKSGDEYVLQAREIEKVNEPDDPYI